MSDDLAKRARELRRSMTEPEVMLWARLKGRGQGRPVFRRQVVLGRMIVDFHCPEARLAVEVDGRTHWDEDAQARDAGRDAWLERRGVRVLRLGAGAVYASSGEAADAAIRLAEERLAVSRAQALPTTPAARSPLPAGGKGRAPVGFRRLRWRR